MKKTGYDYSMNRQTIDDPETMPLESVDMFGMALLYRSGPSLPAEQNHQRVPHRGGHRTCMLIQNDVVKKQRMDAYVGDARFWKAIDDSFEKTEIEKVQRHIGDPEPTTFELRTSEVQLEFKPDGKIADVKPKH